jgi:hypothetical protein
MPLARILLASLTLFLVAAHALGQQGDSDDPFDESIIRPMIPPKPAPAAAPVAERKGVIDFAAASAKIEAALNEETRFEFEELPLHEVAEYLEDLHKIPIQIDGKSLENSGLGSDIPITKSVGGISLESALNRLLYELELTFVIENEVLMIATIELAAMNRELKVYPAIELLEADWNLDAVKRLIKSHTGGECELLGGFLAVRQSQPAHRQTARLIEDLRAAARQAALTK